MKRPLVFMFSGQGSQHYGMGRELYATHEPFRRRARELDEIARSVCGRSLLEEVFRMDRRPTDVFDELSVTHPAIFLFGCALAFALEDRGCRPDLVLGASLGEFVAAVVSGAVSVEEGFALVARHVEVLEELCPPGTMLAVLSERTLFECEPSMFEGCELAGTSFPRHFVVAGSYDAIRSTRRRLVHAGIACQELPVARAFHSSAIDPARAGFAELARGIVRRPTRAPLVSCATVSILDTLDGEHLWRACRSAIRFQEAAEMLERHGAHTYVDVGPSGTLATMMKYNLAPHSGSTVLPIATPFGGHAENLARVTQLTMKQPSSIHPPR